MSENVKLRCGDRVPYDLPPAKKLKRTGTMYYEITSKGNVYRKGVGLVKQWKARWRGEMNVYGKRFRCQSRSKACVESWLMDMREKYGNA